MTTKEIQDLLKKFRVENESQMIYTIIEEKKIELDKIYQNWLEYKGEVPVLNRVLPIANKNKLNNKLAHDFRGLIVDQSIGYMFGNPIVYKIEDESAQKVIDDFKDFIQLEDLDSITATFSFASGYGSRLCYIDQDGKTSVININPWECIFIQDGSTEQMQYALRFYDVDYYEGNKKITKRKVEWYSNTDITFYISIDDKKKEYVYDTTEVVNPLVHNFDCVPLIQFKNNELEQSDFHKVKTIIDSYDRINSDVQNEIEEFRLAYMIFKGSLPDEQTILKARQTGGFGIDKEDSIEYLTKQINDVFVENTKNTEEKNIFRFARAVDMSDEKFSGSAQTGESRKWKLVDLENKCIQKERKFTHASKEMFKVLATAWKKQNIDFDYTKIKMEFRRNLPKDLMYEAQTSQTLKGLVDEETRLSLLSFVDDPLDIIEKMKVDAEDIINLSTIPDEDVMSDGL